MSRNEEVANVFDELADRLLLQGESWFKVRAYRAGAASIRASGEPLELLSAAGRLRTLPGVGKAMIDKTAALLASGSFPLLDRVRTEVPDGLLELLHAGLAPVSVRRLWTEHGVVGPEALRAAVAEGRLDSDAKLRREAERIVDAFAR